METTKYIFWELIKKYSIEIPIIQRDYAQGRDDEKATEIRDKLLSDLFNAITSEKRLDFDFIYGSLEDNKLIPLDGQQRLTTFFLLHWYLANKDRVIDDGIKKVLTRFTYVIRTSSNEFCYELINSGIDFNIIKKESSISNTIINSSWFFLAWKKDPTIKAMLLMLDSIHERFFIAEHYFNKIIDSDKALINFQFISIENFGLTDNLYIKMNARGKALTDFENFKAKFEQLLDVVDKDKKEVFSLKIDNSWTDLFWSYKEDDVIDKPYMRFFYFITEILYFSNEIREIKISPFEFNGKNPKIDFNLVKEVYSNANNIQFLFDSLDCFCNIKNISSFFESIFSTYEYSENKVVLFDNKINLFQRCIEYDGFGLKEKILLFAIIKYCIAIKINECTNDLTDYIRVIRNLLLGWRNQDITRYESNLRIEFLSKQLIDVSLLIDNNIYIKILDHDFVSFNKETINNEKVKADLLNNNKISKSIIYELEDLNLLRGNIQNLNVESNYNVLAIFNNSIKEIWSIKDDSLIVRAFLTIDNYSVNITSCYLGSTYLFGNSFATWNTILTKVGKDSDRIKNLLPAFLIKYNKSSGSNPFEKMQNMIASWLEQGQEKNMRYYFIKYPQMTSNEKHYYSWLNDFEMRRLGSYSFNPLVAYHINPYVYTVGKIIDDPEICKINNCIGRYGEATPLYLNNDVKLFCKNDGWIIVLPENYILPKKIINGFNIQKIDDSNMFLLIDNESMDRIEIAVEFAKQLMK